MRRLPYAAVLLVTILGCDKAGDEAATNDEPDAASSAAKPKSTVEKTTVEKTTVEKTAEPKTTESGPAPAAKNPAPDPSAEILIDRFYRAPGGDVILQLPEDVGPKQDWKLTLDKPGNGRTWSFEYTALMSPGDKPEAFLTLLVAPQGIEPDMSDEDRARTSAESAIKAFVGSASPKLRDLPHPGGVAVEASDTVNGWLTTVVAVAKDGRAVTIGMRTTQRVADFARVRSVFDELLASVRVGSTIPPLPPVDPGEPLVGVYLHTEADGLTHRFMTFFDSGYYHWDLPNDVLDVDLHARFASGTLRLGTYVRRGAELSLKGIAKDKSDTRPFAATDFGFTYADQSWYRIDIAREGDWALDGHWESSSSVVNTGVFDTFTFYGEKNYYFTKDGRFDFDSFAAAQTSRNAGAPAPTTPHGLLGVPDRVMADSETPSRGGNYRIVGDRIILRFDDGRTVTQGFYPIINEATSKPMQDLIYIGGSLYLKE